jgi:hypothetical protein
MILDDVDIEQVVIVWLSEQLAQTAPEASVGEKLPQSDPVNFVRVTRSPGNNDGTTLLPRADVECFAADRTGMWILAGKVNHAIAELCGDVVTIQTGLDDEQLEVMVDDVFTITDPVPGYWSPSVERSIAVYEFDVRSEF